MCDPVVSENLGLRSEPSLEKTIAWIDQAGREPVAQPFAVVFADQHVGNVILDRIDTYLGSARLSVYIGEPTARHSGVGFTAICLALTEGFERLGLHKVWLTVHARNFAAISTYMRVGFVLEGILRDEFRWAGQRVNVLYLGLLADEFRRRIARSQPPESNG